MDLVTPGIGLVFWTSLIFIILLLILSKFAWKPINKMITARNQSIEDALNKAELAKEEMKQLQADNEKIMMEARQERDLMLKEARELKEEMISAAKTETQQEIEKMKKAASMEIQTQKLAAMEEIRNQVLDLSVLVAEKVIRKELKTNSEHETFVDSLLKDVKLN